MWWVRVILKSKWLCDTVLGPVGGSHISRKPKSWKSMEEWRLFSDDGKTEIGGMGWKELTLLILITN